MAPSSGLNRALLGILAQVVSSGTSLALGVISVQASSVSEFASYALALSIYVALLNMSRAAGSTTRLSFGVLAEDDGVLAFTLLVATLPPVAGLLLLALDVSLLRPTVPFLLAFPFLAAYDLIRTVNLTSGSASYALCADLGNFVLASVLALIFVPRMDGGAIAVASATALAGSALGLMLLFVERSSLLPRRALRFFRRHRSAIREFLAEAAVSSTYSQGSTFILSAAGNGAAVAGIRAGSQLVLGPSNVIVYALAPQLLVHSRRCASSGARRRLFLRACIGSLALVVPPVGVFFLPDSVGIRILGESWVVARDMAPAALAALMGSTAYVLATSVARPVVAPSSIRNLRLVTATVSLSGLLVGIGIGEFAVMPSLVIAGALSAVASIVWGYRRLASDGESA